MLLVHFGCHEFWSANHRFGKRTVLERGQTQVANFHAARRPSDEDVVALSHLKIRRHLQADDKSIFDTFLIQFFFKFVVYLQITMDDVWCPRMKEVETFQDLTAPRLEHL